MLDAAQVHNGVAQVIPGKLIYLLTLWCNEVLKSVRAFRPSQIYAGNLYLDNHLISSLKEYFKQKKTLENSYLGSSRLLRSYF